MKILIHDFQLLVKLGCSNEERAFPQIVRVDLEIELESEMSAASDELDDTVDYMLVISELEQLCSACEFKLLEYLAGQMAETILAISPEISGVHIGVKKHLVPQTSGVSVKHSVVREPAFPQR
ncbi:MAG: dihydroneopterin aldolase [Bdellovibrionales bacterium]|nr:dihydroneopterin aldolase [Bdellovibrionales bacterium]